MSLGAPRRHEMKPRFRPEMASEEKDVVVEPQDNSFHVARGFIPLLLYSSIFLIIPLVSKFANLDYTDTSVRVSVISFSVATTSIILLSKDVLVLLNSVLLFHTAIEAFVIERTINYVEHSDDDTTTILSWIAITCVFLHILPFYLTQNVLFLTTCASFGTVLNTALIIFVDPDELLFVAYSSACLLGSTIIMMSFPCHNFALISQLVDTCKDGSWVVCEKY